MNFKYFYIVIVFLIACQNNQNTYLNVSHDVQYVGMNQCAACHSEQYHSFIRTGMGKSFRPAIFNNSALDVDTVLFDSVTNFNYMPYWTGDSLFIKEYEVLKNDIVHDIDYYIDYIIGFI